MRRQIWYLVGVILVALALSRGKIVRGAGSYPWEERYFQAQQAQSDNLLVNGSMEEGFYWEYPNHFVANGWERWWIGNIIPEYDDVRAWRPYRYDGEHAQIYYWIWPQGYTAGIFQQVAVQPCTFYQFDIYGRNVSYHDTDHHARIGIDPLGRKYGLAMSSLPDGIVWSAEQTFFNTWGQHIVATESYSDHITAVTYVSPDPGYAPYETFWDAGELIETQPPDGRLPAPDQLGDGFITNVITSTSLDHLVVEWDTLGMASTQVWYSPLDTTTITSTSPYTESVLYLPLIFHNYGAIPDFQYFTTVDQTPFTHHRVKLGPFSAGDQKLQFITLSRRLDGGECRTSASELMEVTFHINTIYRLYLPLIER